MQRVCQSQHQVDDPSRDANHHQHDRRFDRCVRLIHQHRDRRQGGGPGEHGNGERRYGNVVASDPFDDFPRSLLGRPLRLDHVQRDE